MRREAGRGREQSRWFLDGRQLRRGDRGEAAVVVTPGAEKEVAAEALGDDLARVELEAEPAEEHQILAPRQAGRRAAAVESLEPLDHEHGDELAAAGSLAEAWRDEH